MRGTAGAGLRPGDSPSPARRRRVVLSGVVAVVVVAGAVGVGHGITVGRWITPVEEAQATLDVTELTDAATRSGAGRTALPTVTAMPTPEPTVTPTPEPEPTADPHSGLIDTAVPEGLDGTLVAAAGERAATRDGTVRTVRVEVEKGLPVDRAVFAEVVMTTLDDDKGWSTLDGVAFARVDGEADYVVTLASPDATDALCAPLNTGGWLSCGIGNRATLNFDRWVEGAEDFGDDVATYRQYLVNHEVGHLLGHGHVQCTGDGDVADVMVQQTISAQGCVVNGWPTATRD